MLTWKTSFKGANIELLTSLFGLGQKIKESTHILENSMSCVDLIFTSQPNMVMNPDIRVLCTHCDQQLVFTFFDLKIFIHLLMKGLFGNYIQVNTDHIRRATDGFD